MDHVLGDLKWRECLVYMDDILIFADTFEELLVRTRHTFDRLREFQLTMKLKKCNFAQSSIFFLNHLVDEHGTRMDPAKVEAIRESPTPSCLRQVKKFVGACLYYRKFIPGSAKIAAPLTDVNREEKFFTWTPKQQAALTV